MIQSTNNNNDKEYWLKAIRKNAGFLKLAPEEIQELCKGKNPVEALEMSVKVFHAEKLHIHLQEVVPPKTLEFAKSLSAECKQTPAEQSTPKSRLKI